MDVKVLIAGCGDIGTQLGRRLAAAGVQAYGLRRNIDKLPDCIHGIAADLSDPAGLQVLASQHFSAVVLLATAREYTEAAYQQAYVEGLGNLLQSLAAAPPARVFFASSTAVYHQQDGSWVDETSPTAPTGFSGRLHLEAEQLLERQGIPSTVVRFGGIYGPGRTRLIQSLRQGEMVAAEVRNYSNRIHSADAAAVLHHLLDRQLQGKPLQDCYLAVDCAPTPLRQVSEWLAAEMGLPLSTMSAVGKAGRGGNKRCSNRRLLDSGYRFIYPDFQAGYRSLLEAG